MALELKIPITADANSAISGLNDTADSASKLFRKFAEGKATLEQFERQLGEDIAVAASKAGYGLKGMQAQYKGLLNFMERARQKWGGESEIYKDIAASADYAKSEIDRMKGLTEATNVYTTAVKNAAPAVDKFATATKELDSTSKSYLTRLVTLTKNILTFQLIMGPIRSAVSGVRNTLKDSTKTAAEAEQIYSKLTTVFDNFEDSARRASVALASSIGVAQSTASSALSTVGDLLQAQGMGTAQSLSKASSWVRQFQDIIAFKDINMSLEEFAQNFMSGAAGNLRNFRTFGSIVKESAVNARLASEGLDKLTGSQLELAKMTTRATMALEQQKNAMGATEREWDTMLSVNRRLSESWKEYKENLGDTLNSIVKPMKQRFAEMLTEINKVKRAAKELKNGALTSSVYNIRDNEKDYKTFKKNVLEEFNTYEGDYTKLSRGTIGAEDTLGIEALDYVLRMFNASVYDLARVLGDKLPLKAYELLSELEKQRKKEEQLLKDIDSRKTTIATMADSFSAFQEALLGIAGVNFDATDVSHLVERGSGSDAGMNQALGIIGDLTFQNIDKALASLNTDDLAATFGNVISGALDDLDEAGLREAQVESLRKLFEASWNQFAEGGFTKEEKDKLEDIRKSYKQASDALDAYNKKIQIQAALLSASGSTASVLSNTARMKYENGLTGPQSSKDLNMALNWDIPLLVQDFAKSLRDAGVDLKTVMERSEGYRKALIAEANLKYAMSLAAEDAAAREGLRNAVPTTSRTALANFGMSERDQLVAKRDELASKHNALWVEYQKEIEALDELTKLEAQKALLDKVNPFSGVQSAWQMGEAAGVGGLMGILADILSQTEAFSELAGIVSDTLVPIFNAILKPLMPALKAMTSLFDALPWDVFFEVFKIVAEAIVIISTVVKVISAVIKNIFTAVHNILQRILHPFTGGDQREYENIEKILQDADENLEKIKNSSFEIERNTGEDANVAALRELWHAGIIDNQGVYEGAKVLQKDLAFESLDGYAANVTYNITNNITVNANDEAGMNKFKRTMEENGIPLGYTFRVNGYSY